MTSDLQSTLLPTLSHQLPHIKPIHLMDLNMSLLCVNLCHLAKQSLLNLCTKCSPSFISSQPHAGKRVKKSAENSKHIYTQKNPKNKTRFKLD